MAPHRKSSFPARMLQRLLPDVPPSLYGQRDVPEDADLRIRYLGTAGFVLTGAQRTIVLDPFVSRPGLRATAGAPLVPDAELIREIIPRADDVLIGHAHHDHVLDAPVLCQQTGARFIGSPDAANVARAAGLPEEQIVETTGREDIACGQAKVRGLPAAHGRVYFGRVTLPGNIPEPPPWPPRFRDLRHGQVFNWYVEIAGLRIVHIDSAEFFREELEGMKADIVCLCAIGRRYRPRYVEECLELLQPRMVIACHWDWFFTPWGEPPVLLPGVDLGGFVREIESAGVDAVVMPLDGEIGVAAEP